MLGSGYIFLNRGVILSIKLLFCCLGKKNTLTKSNLWNKELICAHGYGRLDVCNIRENVIAEARAEGFWDHILTAHRKQCENWKVGPGYEPGSPVLPPKGSLTSPNSNTYLGTKWSSTWARFSFKPPHPPSQHHKRPAHSYLAPFVKRFGNGYGATLESQHSRSWGIRNAARSKPSLWTQSNNSKPHSLWGCVDPWPRS